MPVSKGIKLSERKYRVRFERNFLIPVRNSVELAADLYRPDAEGKFPAILTYTPYRKDDFSRPRLADELGYFAERGYVGIVLDVPGTGSSTGSTSSMNSLEESLAGRDAIEYIADQRWCSSNIGMTGSSYTGATTLFTSAQDPPHLKATMPMLSAYDRYLSSHYPGGALRTFYFILYAAGMLAFNSAPPYQDAKGRWLEVWKEHLEKNKPWLYSWLEHQERDELWKESSLLGRFDQIKAATYIIGGWHDIYPSTPFKVYEKIRAPKKMLIGPWMHSLPAQGVPSPRVDHRFEGLKWFDYWLKGIDTGVMNELPVTIFVRKFASPSIRREEEPGYWRDEEAWPIQRASNTVYYLREGGALLLEKGKVMEHDFLPYKVGVGTSAGIFDLVGLCWGLPLDQRTDEAYSLVYTTQPLEEDLEITGFPRTSLYLASSVRIFHVVASLSDVSADGTSALVTRGILNATHRDSHEAPSYLELGKIYKLDMDLEATSYLFEKDHRIRLAIRSSDFPNTWPPPDPADILIYRGSKYPSSLILPVIATLQRDAALLHELHPSVEPLPSPQVNIHSLSFSSDFANSQKAFEVLFDARLRIDDTFLVYRKPHGKHFISDHNLASALVESSSTVLLEGPANATNISAKCVVRSDERAFHAHATVSIDVNGVPYWSRVWFESIPRKYV